MEIRTVTLFAEPSFAPESAESFIAAARSAFDVPVQTTRLATTPFPTWWDLYHFTNLQADELIQPWTEAGIDFISLGPVGLRHDAGWLNHVPEIIACCPNLFVSAEIADTDGQIDLGRCQAVAEVIRRLSTLNGDGSANLQFAALAGCEPGTPFFPTAYHRGGSAHFALGIQAADLALKAITNQPSLSTAQNALVKEIENAATRFTETANELASQYNLSFSGIDFSLAPFPTDDQSLALALERLGLAGFGAPGTLFAAAFVADAIGRANFCRCGYSGLFFPVLEDSVLVRSVAAGQVDLNKLLSYAAVCGIGLDTVPLPGNTDANTLTGILLDVAALSARLKKPLSARLMPIPGKMAGEPFKIDFDWFVPGQIPAVTNAGVSAKLTQPTRIQLFPYHQG